MNTLSYLIAKWPKPFNTYAVTTTRHTGVSQYPFDNNNLALHVKDNPIHVNINRELLTKQLLLPRAPEWLEQTHSTECVIIEEDSNRVADAAITRQANTVLAILTADCLPILVSHKNGQEVAAIHAGWKGLLNGIIEKTLAKLSSPASDYIAWIGPAICKQCYPVNEDIKEKFTQSFSYSQRAFTRTKDKWLFDLPHMAELILQNQGVNAIYLSSICTFEQANDFYSYRHSAQTGRIASLIWFN